MLQTPYSPKKRRKILPNPMEAGVSSLPGQCSSYTSLPAKYAGYPNYMQYRVGTGLDLVEANLSDADLRWSNFRCTNLSRAKFAGSIVWGSTFTNADLRHADLSHADFTGSDSVGADLSDANTEGACFLGARYSKATRFPTGFGDPESKGLVGLKESMQLD